VIPLSKSIGEMTLNEVIKEVFKEVREILKENYQLKKEVYDYREKEQTITEKI
jgi:hypothetical protein